MEDQVKIIKNEHWIYIINEKDYTDKVTGKYLYFSEDQDKLIQLAKKILAEYKLGSAKVSTLPESNNNYVLCVYDESPRYGLELKKYADFKEIHYRWWKSDEDTNSGKYSEEFLQRKGG